MLIHILRKTKRGVIKIKFYLSHPIRGSKGKDATAEDMQKNNDVAIAIANYLRENITTHISIHVPAEMEEFVLTAYYLGVLTEGQILAVDCKIIEGCDAVILYAPEGIIGGGCKIELDYATKHGIPVFIGRDADMLLNMVANFILRT